MEQSVSYSLSPDAAVFIPRQFPSDGPLQVQQIPTYMTNCYPFVQLEAERQKNLNQHGRISVPLPGHHPRPSGQRLPRGFPGPGTRMPVPQTFNPSVPPPLENAWMMPPPSSVPPVNFMNFLPHSDVTFPQDKELQQKISPRGHKKQGWYPREETSKEGIKQGDKRGKRREAGGAEKKWAQRSRNNSGKSNTSEGQREEGRTSSQNKRRSRVKDGWGGQGQPSSDHQPGTPAAVGMTDTAVQTEFSDSFANQTLAQYPSPIYNPKLGNHGNRQGIGSSSEDSDSGYHSPLHRKNQVTSGTQPVGVMPVLVISPSQSKNDYSRLVADQGKTKKSPPKQPGGSKENPSSQQIFSYAFIAQSKPVIESSVKMEVKMEEESKKSEGKKTEGEDSGNEGKKKRKRNRRKRRKKKDGTTEESEIVAGKDSKQIELHFQDEEEFPDLRAGQDRAGGSERHPSSISYSSIVSQSKSSTQTAVLKQSEPTSSQELDMNELNSVRNSRRRKKKLELVQQAADEELAEISLEQQMLRELNLKPSAKGQPSPSQANPVIPQRQGPGKATSSQPGILKVPPQNQPQGKKGKPQKGIALDLSAMIDALEKKKPEVNKAVEPKVTRKPEVKAKENKKPGSGHNMLDSSAPLKRGKERENPKPKKPSSLKKVILKEREEKKKMRLLDDAESANNGVSLGIGVVSGNESDLSQDAHSSKGSVVDYTGTGTPASNDLSPISQTSPISMSPLSPGVSPQSSEVNSPIAGTIGKEVRMKIHSRRFREYCNQVLNKDIDSCCTRLLQDLVRFQDRMYHKDPVKAKTKRRIVLGLREVTKHLKLKKIKLVIISPNLEKIQSKGGLDDALNNILNLCNEQNIPFVFALGRRALGRACAKLVPVSVVGIFNYSGTEDNFHSLMDLTEQARQAYKEMVNVIEREIRDYPTLGAAAAVPHIYAHMGHSRTPSGASVLSFTSSLLSEPISENYPHSEPETDAAGYEIPRARTDPPPPISRGSIQAAYESQMRLIYPTLDVDDGNEADTEEGVTKGHHHDDGSSDSDPSSEENTKTLPHIDSIHSSTYDLNTEILSQNSGRTVDNCDAISTHSSRTLGDGSSTLLADPGERSKHGTPKSIESPSNTLQRGKVIDSERIQNWVDQTKSRLEDLQYLQENSDSSDESNSSEEDTVDELNLSSGFSKTNGDTKTPGGEDPLQCAGENNKGEEVTASSTTETTNPEGHEQGQGQTSVTQS